MDSCINKHQKDLKDSLRGYFGNIFPEFDCMEGVLDILVELKPAACQAVLDFTHQVNTFAHTSTNRLTPLLNLKCRLYGIKQLLFEEKITREIVEAMVYSNEDTTDILLYNLLKSCNGSTNQDVVMAVWQCYYIVDATLKYFYRKGDVTRSSYFVD